MFLEVRDMSTMKLQRDKTSLATKHCSIYCTKNKKIDHFLMRAKSITCTQIYETDVFAVAFISCNISKTRTVNVTCGVE